MSPKCFRNSQKGNGLLLHQYSKPRVGSIPDNEIRSLSLGDKTPSKHTKLLNYLILRCNPKVTQAKRRAGWTGVDMSRVWNRRGFRKPVIKLSPSHFYRWENSGPLEQRRPHHWLVIQPKWNSDFLASTQILLLSRVMWLNSLCVQTSQKIYGTHMDPGNVNLRWYLWSSQYIVQHPIGAQ